MATETHKLYLKTASKLNFLLDLIDAGLAFVSDEGLAISLKPGVAVHYVGRMVKTPAEYETTVLPPVEKTPAVYYDGERANVLLSGANIGELRSAFYVATFTRGTEIMAEPESPKSQWA